MKRSKTVTAVAFLTVLGCCLLLVLAGMVRVALGYPSTDLHRPPEEITYLGLVDWFEDTCRSFCTTELPGRTELMEANASLNRHLGKWIFEHTSPPVVRLKNGYLESAEHIFYYQDQADKKVAAFKAYAHEQGWPFLYIQAPCKHCAVDDQLPVAGMTNVNEEATWLLRGLTKREVPWLDLRESLHADGLDHYGCFFVTDHHWTLPTGLWAARTAGEALNENCGLDLDTSVLAEENFETRVWEDVFLGSWGRKVTLSYASPEDFALPLPTAEPRLHVTVPEENIDRTGGFEVLYDESKIVPEDFYTGNSYGAMLYGNQGYVKIENLGNPEGPVVVLLRESFAGAMAPYLALTAGELHLVDARYYGGSVKELLEELRPDAVACMLNVQCHTGAYFDLLR